MPSPTSYLYVVFLAAMGSQLNLPEYRRDGVHIKFEFRQARVLPWIPRRTNAMYKYAVGFVEADSTKKKMGLHDPLYSARLIISRVIAKRVPHR